MNTGMIVLGIILTLLFVSPFIFFRDTKRKSKQKNLVEGLKVLASNNYSNIGEKELWNNSAIAIDTNKQMVFYCYKSEVQAYEKVISLADVIGCRVITTSHTAGFKKEKYKVVDTIALVFEHQNQSIANEVILFYDNEVDGLTMNGEILIAQAWEQKVKDAIGSNHIKRAS